MALKIFKDPKCKLRRFLLGLIPFGILLFIPGVAITLYMIATCTAGIGFVFVVVPMIYFLGALVQKSFFKETYNNCERLIFQYSKNKNSSGINEKLSTDQKTLIKYILQVQDIQSKREITASLKSSGWTNDKIKAAFAFVE